MLFRVVQSNLRPGGVEAASYMVPDSFTTPQLVTRKVFRPISSYVQHTTLEGLIQQQKNYEAKKMLCLFDLTCNCLCPMRLI